MTMYLLATAVLALVFASVALWLYFTPGSVGSDEEFSRGIWLICAALMSAVLVCLHLLGWAVDWWSTT